MADTSLGSLPTTGTAGVISLGQIALEQIISARNYTHRLLADLQPEDWFRQPAEGVTHIAWQVGHLAFAEFRICVERMRPVTPADADVYPPKFTELFGVRTTPVADPAAYPAPSEILDVFNRVHELVCREVAGYADEFLTASILRPHPLFENKLAALRWCPLHEMTHAGQIGLLRRLIGKAPQW